MKRLLSLMCVLAWVGCSESEAPQEPFEPTLPTPIEAEDEPAAEPSEPAGDEPEGPSLVAPDEAVEAPAVPQRSDTKRPASGKAKPSVQKPGAKKPAPTPTQEDEAADTPEPAAAAPKPKPDAPKTVTRIPNTKNVQVVVGSLMQTRLNSDSRMQGWINKVMAVAEQCYAQVRAKDASAGGTLVVRVTMHENSRPSPDITQLPPALSNLVACATGKLFSVRMPLFTGPEGEKHTVKLVFKP